MTPQPDESDLAGKFLDALLDRFARSRLKTNPSFDRKKFRENDYIEDPDNPYLVPMSRAELLNLPCLVTYKDHEGGIAVRPLTYGEIIDTLLDALGGPHSGQEG